jgi:magnesium transporter
MLILHSCTTGTAVPTIDFAQAHLPNDIGWIDIINGTEEELAFIKRTTHIDMPTLAELSEIENSSRLRYEDRVLYLSTPIVSHASTGAPVVAPVGFILTPDLLITVRFAELTSFTTFAKQPVPANSPYSKGVGAFIGLMDAIIDRAADVLENIGGELEQMSHRIFGINMNSVSVRKRPAKEDADLREILRRVGRCGDLVSKIRDSLLGLGRIVPYVAGKGGDKLPAELRAHLDTQRYDIMSLSDYDAHLSNKVQFLLDATLGLINIEQNNIIKVLTIVSVVGVPPTLIASMYGMNFRHMPELEWAWGYPYGLALIFISAVLPLAWFKFRGWL